MVRRPPEAPFFPYTTLFRSSARSRVSRRSPRASAGPRGTVGRGPWPSRLFARPVQGRAKPCSARLRSEEHTSELQSRGHLVCRLLLEKKKRRRTRIFLECLL